MSEISPGRRRRADAERSAAAVLDAAVRVMGQRPEASVEEVAAAAGVTRQTVYAHYPSRQVLLAAVVERITAEALGAIEAARLAEGSAYDALLRWLDSCWRLLRRYPLLLHPSVTEIAPQESYRQHAPIMESLSRLIHRGQQSGEFDRELSVDWLVSATIALGHAAGAEVAAGRMTVEQAAATLRTTIARLYLRPN